MLPIPRVDPGAVRRRHRGVAAGILFVAIAALLFLGRDPPSTAEDSPGYSVNTVPRLAGWDDPRLGRLAAESDGQFAERMTRVVSQAIYHCEIHSTARVIDWLASRVVPHDFREVGLLTPSALRCGFCNQVSYVLARALERGGVEADLLVLNGHVVTLASFDGKRWLADADFGVGPVEYPADFATVEPAYRRVTKHHDNWLSQIAAAYATSADDGPYYRSMEWLQAAEGRQRVVIGFLEIARWAFLAIGLMLMVNGARR